MLIIVCIFSLNISANEVEGENNAGIIDYTECVVPTEEEDATNADAAPLPPVNSSTDENESAKDNVFELMFNEVTSYFSEILCALTFLSSIVVALAYKKGLVPIVEGSLGAISKAITKIKEKGEESDKTAKNNYDALITRVGEYEGAIAELQEKVGALTLSLAPFSEELKNNKLIEELIVSQTTMLHDVFMASSLPAYQKDRVEAHFKRMMEDLRGEE